MRDFDTVGIVFVRLSAMARGNRFEITANVRDAFSEAGAFITDAHLFSGVLTVLHFECEREALVELARCLTAAGLSLDEESHAAIAAGTKGKGDEAQGTLAITFVDGDPDLEREIPDVPG